MLDDHQRQQLFAGLVAHSKKIMWSEPLEDEREPDFTARVLTDPINHYVRSRNHPTLMTRSDGGDRPLPVVFDGQKFYPDIAIYDSGSRELAVEVKFLQASSYSGQLTTAVGQGLVYRTFGYESSVVILVSREGRRVLAQESLEKLNANLEAFRIAIVQLSD